MESLTECPPTKQIDVRLAIGVSPATMNEICKKAGLAKHLSKKGRLLQPEEVAKILAYRGIDLPIGNVITIMTGKGGVGKTTTTYFLGNRLASYGAKVLMIDADPSGNLSAAANLSKWGFELDKETPILADVFIENCKLQDTIVPIHEYLHLIPSTPINSVLENRIKERYKNHVPPMKIALSEIKNNYNYILIDCGPTLCLLNSIMMYASDHIIMPLNADKFARIAIDQTFDEIRIINRDYPEWKPKVNILFTKYDARELLAMKYFCEVAEVYKDVVFSTVINTTTAFKNAIEKQISLYDLNEKSAKKGRDDYDDLAKEIIGLKTKRTRSLEN